MNWGDRGGGIEEVLVSAVLEEATWVDPEEVIWEDLPWVGLEVAISGVYHKEVVCSFARWEAGREDFEEL